MRLRVQLPAAAGAVLTAAVVLVGIWLPQFAHYYVANVPLSAAVIEEARRAPDGGTLRALGALTPGYFVGRGVLELSEPVRAADRLLQGAVEVPGLPQTKITVPFSPGDVAKGNGGWQLSQAALTLPLLLLRAYEATGQDRYLFAARDMIVAWSNFEQRTWLPTGFLWNDHAVAARVPVLAAFWLAYRGHPAYDPAVAASVLQLVARSAALLARPDHFTVATNHGIMQNLALWHYSLAFTSLPHAQEYAQTALARFDHQMRFYLNDEGAILEHSAGYQRAGVELLTLALTYLQRLHVPPAPSWIEKYDRSLAFYTALRRPDGSLPLLGDTGAGADPAGPLIIRALPEGSGAAPSPRPTWPHPEPNTLLPAAGYAIWWQGLEHWPAAVGLRQTTIAWSYFPGHGHKHADEPSLDIWADGRRWLTNVGYWPDEGRGRSQAESWGGSNAPHLVDEPVGSVRSTRLLSNAWSDGLAAIDLERRLRGGYQVRRQVLYVAPGIWVVVDHASGVPAAVTRTQWTTSPDITIDTSGPAGGYVLRPRVGAQSMSLDLLSSAAATIRGIRGSFDPFAGWVVVARTPTPADAVVVDQPAGDSWNIAVWCLEAPGTAHAVGSHQPVTGRFRSDEDWSVSLSGLPGAVTISRSGPMLQVARPGRSESANLILAPGQDVRPDRERLQAAYVEAAQRYPRFRDLGSYRLRVTYALLAALGFQEVCFVVFPPADTVRARLRLAILALWLAGGAWLALFYFR